MKIGVFDSGFGGLTILKDIVKTLPEYDYLYLGDNARTPYGDRSSEIIYEFTRQGVEHLFKNDCIIVILACNTASAHALRRLQQEWLPSHYPNRRILGIIIPIVEKIASIPGDRAVGLIGTRATVQSHIYEKELQKRTNNQHPIIARACPLLVPLIEEGWHTTIPAKMILKKYLSPLKNKNIRNLILGCTHYPLLFKSIKKIMGKNINVINPGPIISRSLSDYLQRHPEIESKVHKNGAIIFHTTDMSEKFSSLARKLWGEDIKATSVVIDR